MQVAVRPANVRTATDVAAEARSALEQEQVKEAVDKAEIAEAINFEDSTEEMVNDDREKDRVNGRPTGFGLGVAVELKDLVNAAQHNGKHAVVRRVDDRTGVAYQVS